MLLSLQTYFDTGVTYGIGDAVFGRKSPMVPDIRGVGLRNPLGLGVSVRLDNNSETLALWRAKALEQVSVPEMEFGFEHVAKHPEIQSHSTEELHARLREFIEKAKLSCELTVYALGTGFLRLDIGENTTLPFLRGVGRCFEYAAYHPDTAEALLKIARRRCTPTAPKRNPMLEALTFRPDATTQEDERGNTESRFVTSFTPVVICMTAQDDADQIKKALQPDPYQEIKFEFHGTIHFNWGGCVIVPRAYDQPMQHVERILWCIHIAHAFLGTCEAFENLFFTETLNQVGFYVGSEGEPRTPQQLNQLRTLALAVVSLTRYEAVSITEEDQNYFKAWEHHVKLADRHKIIQQRCEVLHNVQDADKQAEDTRRERILNNTVLVLTAFTFMTVVVDLYLFAEDNAGWLALRGRALLLLCLFSLTLIASVVLLNIRAGALRTRRPRKPETKS